MTEWRLSVKAQQEARLSAPRLHFSCALVCTSGLLYASVSAAAGGGGMWR